MKCSECGFDTLFSKNGICLACVQKSKSGKKFPPVRIDADAYKMLKELSAVTGEPMIQCISNLIRVAHSEQVKILNKEG